MSSDLGARLNRLERLSSASSCRTCRGSGPCAVVGIPEGVDPDDPAYESRPCPECGRAPRNVLRIIGMSDQELG